MYKKDLRLVGPTFDYRIRYKNIWRTFLLPKPDKVYFFCVILMSLEHNDIYYCISLADLIGVNNLSFPGYGVQEEAEAADQGTAIRRGQK